jgi:hypothetical protein
MEGIKKLEISIDEKLYYGLQLLSRVQHRSIDEVIRWSVFKTLYDPSYGLIDKNSKLILERLWHKDSVTRFYWLSVYKPELLDYDQQILDQIIKSTGLYDDLIDEYESSFEEFHAARLKKLKENYDEFLKLKKKEEQ